LIQLLRTSVINALNREFPGSDSFLDKVHNERVPRSQLKAIGGVCRNQNLGIGSSRVRKIKCRTFGKLRGQERLIIIFVNSLQHHSLYFAIDIDNPWLRSKPADVVDAL